MAVTRLGSSNARPFARGGGIRAAAFQRDLLAKVDPIRAIIDRGLIIESPDIGVEKLPDGRIKLRLKNRIGGPLPAAQGPPAPPTPGAGSAGTFVDFYTATTGDNYNSGSSEGAAIYSSTNGNWNQSTNTFTPTDGSNPVSAGVAADKFASLFLDGPTGLAWYARISSVTNAVNGAIVLVSQSVGSSVATGATGRTIRVGGAWAGPSALGITNVGQLQDSAGNEVRINMKNDAEYVRTATLNLPSFGLGKPIVVQGYTSTKGDGGRAIWSTATAGVTLLTGNSLNCNWVDLEFKCTASSGTADNVSPSAGQGFFRCVFRGSRGSGIFAAQNTLLHECEAYECLTGGFTSSTQLICVRCYSHNHNTAAATTSSHGFNLFSGSGHVLVNCIAENCKGSGIRLVTNVAAVVKNCDLYNNGVDGIAINIASGNELVVFIENCNFIKNTGKGINNSSVSTAFPTGYIFNCGYGSGTMANGGANVLQRITEVNPITYAADADPWTSRDTGNFTLSLPDAIGSGRGLFYESGNSKSGTVGTPNIGAA